MLENGLRFTVGVSAYSAFARLLETAVHGRHEGGQLAAMRGPFFLHDLPRSLKEFAQLEDRYGDTPIALRFVQKDYEAV